MNKEIIKSIIILPFYINLIYQFVRMVICLRKLNFSEETNHRFICTKCQQENVYPGNQVKKHMKNYRTSVKINGNMATYFKVECPHCQTFTKQMSIKEIAIDRRLSWPMLNGHIRFVGNRNILPYLKRFFIWGFLPTVGLILVFAIIG